MSPSSKGLIAEADALIIASPVYFLGAHGSVKMLLDRAFSFYPIMGRMRGTCRAILAVTYGLEDRIGAAPQTLLTFAAFLGTLRQGVGDPQGRHAGRGACEKPPADG